MSSTFRPALLAAFIIPLAIWTRWHSAPEPKGARFHPWPDAVDYAAEAQALARSGEVYLQIGPHRVRPRYPPGWPMLIAPAIWLGVQGQNLWRITAIFGAALAWLLAMVAARTTEALSPPETRSGAGPFVAALLAGGVWALTPIAVDLGATLMSDEPTALVSLASLVCTGAGLLRKDGRVSWLLAAGGLAFGLAAAMRSIAAALMVPPILLFLLGCVRRFGARTALRRGLPWLAGAAVFPAITVLVMLRSGWPAWEWSGYRFWIPQRFDRLSHAFNLRFALEPDQAFRQSVEGRPLSHLELAVRVLLGLPGLAVRHYLGFFWPILGWLAAIPLLRVAKRRGGSAAEIAVWTAPALLLWLLGHVVVFSLYFYPASRFYLAPLALCLVLFAAACGLSLAQPRRRVRLVASAAAALVLFFTLQGFLALRKEPLPRLRKERTRASFTRWLGRRDEARADRVMPFDPVHAQALGLLTPEVAAGVREWGELPNTVHVRRLRANGFLPAPPHLPSPPLPKGEEGERKTKPSSPSPVRERGPGGEASEGITPKRARSLYAG
jgi:4-amino-4-deoxy-L-arabinose transferase-like glycosyltransferase